MRAALAPDTVGQPPTDTPTQYRVGDRREFELDEGPEQAELIHITDHTYTWLVVGVQADRAALVNAAEFFESQIYPTVRNAFGSEWSPGIDGDVHLSILHYYDPGSDTAGFFSPSDELPRWVDRYSNETEMFYVNLDGMDPGEDYYYAVLAHEFEHMIHWKADRNEEDWLDEGLAELACRLAGFDPGDSRTTFILNPDTQLTDWPYDGDTTVHYGSGYMFALYLYERFGEAFIRDLIRQPADGLAALDIVLESNGAGVDADQLFADWVLVNALDEGEYAYATEDWKADLGVDNWHDEYPIGRDSTVLPYGTDYVELSGQGDLAINFRGDSLASLFPVKGHTGMTYWWSNRGNRSDARLMRRFDLSGLSSATLRFWTWYDLEQGYDYVYVSASGDGGQTWEVLQPPTATSRDVYGPAYNGQSNAWIEEAVDLSRYAGGEVVVRFDYVTDDSINGTGFLIDDVSIPELGFSDPCDEEGEWEAEGFVLVGASVPVRWAVQLIEFPTGGSPRISRMTTTDQFTGELELSLGGEVERAILAISAMTRWTTEPLSYHYDIVLR